MEKYKVLVFFMCAILCVNCGQKNDPTVLKLTEESGETAGYNQGFSDGSNGLAYKAYYNDVWQFHGDNAQNAELQEHRSRGYKRGYDKGYQKGVSQHAQKNQNQKGNDQNQHYNEGVVYETRTSTPNTYPSEDSYENESYSTDKNATYRHYRDNSSCYDGEVIYEGRLDYFIIRTSKLFLVAERREGNLREYEKVKGEFESYNYGNLYILNKTQNEEVLLFVKQFFLTKDAALEYLGERDKLRPTDQTEYNELYQ